MKSNSCFLRGAAVLAIVSFLPSCAMDDGSATRAQGAGAGAVLGGIAGGIIGHQSGHGMEGALLGAGIGGLAGLAYGDHVARKKQAYASTEAYLDACIAQASRVNADAYAYNRSLSNRIAALERETENAIAARDTNRMRAAQRQVAALNKEAKGQVTVVNEEITIQRQVVTNERGASNVGELRSEVGKLESTRGGLNQNLNRLATLNNRLDV